MKNKYSMSTLSFVCFDFVAVLRSMVTATAFQILVSNNVAIKANTDSTIVTLEVSMGLKTFYENF